MTLCGAAIFSNSSVGGGDDDGDDDELRVVDVIPKENRIATGKIPGKGSKFRNSAPRESQRVGCPEIQAALASERCETVAEFERTLIREFSPYRM